MYKAKLRIPKIMPENYDIYIYRSRHYSDIATAKACRKLSPIMKIDQSVAPFETLDEIYDDNGDLIYWQDQFVVYDWEPYIPVPGVEYYGPHTNNVPTREFELTEEAEFINNFTFYNYLKITPLPLPPSVEQGTTYFYSVIGVDEDSKTITNLKTHSLKILYPETADISYHIYQCYDYTGSDTDEWIEVGAIQGDEEEIIIGKTGVNEHLGIPVIETVPEISIEDDEVNVSLAPLLSSNFMVLEVINPWQANNKRFNFRKLKSYKIVSTANEMSSDASEPTFQSLVPVSIEKMIIYMQTDPVDELTKKSFNNIDESERDCFKVIRKDGVYYNRSEYKKYGFNLWNIPSEYRRLSVFSEGSVQDMIKIQIPASAGHTYTFDIYLVDVYGNHNNGIHYIVRA